MDAYVLNARQPAMAGSCRCPSVLASHRAPTVAALARKCRGLADFAVERDMSQRCLGARGGSEPRDSHLREHIDGPSGLIGSIRETSSLSSFGVTKVRVLMRVVVVVVVSALAMTVVARAMRMAMSPQHKVSDNV